MDLETKLKYPQYNKLGILFCNVRIGNFNTIKCLVDSGADVSAIYNNLFNEIDKSYLQKLDTKFSNVIGVTRTCLDIIGLVSLNFNMGSKQMVFEFLFLGVCIKI